LPVLSQLQLKDSKQCVRKVIAATKNKSLIASSLLAGVTVCGSPTCSVQKKLSDNRIITHGIGPWLMFLFLHVIESATFDSCLWSRSCRLRRTKQSGRPDIGSEVSQHVNRVSGQNGYLEVEESILEDLIHGLLPRTIVYTGGRAIMSCVASGRVIMVYD
jgi:hypothetical protein